MTDTHLWKHYVPVTTVVGSNYCFTFFVLEAVIQIIDFNGKKYGQKSLDRNKTDCHDISNYIGPVDP